MNAMDFGLEVVELESRVKSRRHNEVYIPKDKNGKCTFVCISADIAAKLPWINGERLNLLARKDAALFGLMPSRTGLVTLKAKGNNYRINNTDLATTIRAKSMKYGYGDVLEYKAWIAGEILMFAPKEADDD